MSKKFKFFLIAFLVLLTVSVWYFTTTPYYTVIRIALAIQNQNTDDFQFYCDMDSLSESLVDEILLTPYLSKNFTEIQKIMLNHPNESTFFKKMLANGIKNQILKGIKENKLPSNAEEKFQKSDFLSLKTETNNENYFVITMEITHNQQKIPLHLRFRKLEARWKLVGIEKFSEVIFHFINPK